MEPLFNDYEKIILFATLGEDIFSVDEVRFTDDGFFTLYFFFIDKVYALVQLGTCLAIPLLRCYDGTRGRWRAMGKLFYVYYPAHLALIGVLRVLLWGAGASTAAGSF